MIFSRGCQVVGAHQVDRNEHPVLLRRLPSRQLDQSAQVGESAPGVGRDRRSSLRSSASRVEAHKDRRAVAASQCPIGGVPSLHRTRIEAHFRFGCREGAPRGRVEGCRDAVGFVGGRDDSTNFDSIHNSELVRGSGKSSSQVGGGGSGTGCSFVGPHETSSSVPRARPRRGFSSNARVDPRRIGHGDLQDALISMDHNRILEITSKLSEGAAKLTEMTGGMLP